MLLSKKKDIMPHHRIMRALNQLFLKQLAVSRISDTCLLQGPECDRPVHVPMAVCEFVEQHMETILGILFTKRFSHVTVTEIEFLDEASKVIRQLTSSEYGNIHADAVAAAENTMLDIDDFYVALAIYAKQIALARDCSPRLSREETHGIVYVRYLH